LNSMRVASWNLCHQTRERPLNPIFHLAVRALVPDVLVLNEYVDGRAPLATPRDFSELSGPCLPWRDFAGTEQFGD